MRKWEEVRQEKEAWARCAWHWDFKQHGGDRSHWRDDPGAKRWRRGGDELQGCVGKSMPGRSKASRELPASGLHIWKQQISPSIWSKMSWEESQTTGDVILLLLFMMMNYYWFSTKSCFPQCHERHWNAGVQETGANSLIWMRGVTPGAEVSFLIPQQWLWNLLWNENPGRHPYHLKAPLIL